jgi:hypothetical protein
MLKTDRKSKRQKRLTKRKEDKEATTKKGRNAKTTTFVKYSRWYPLQGFPRRSQKILRGF